MLSVSKVALVVGSLSPAGLSCQHNFQPFLPGLVCCSLVLSSAHLIPSRSRSP